MGYGPFYAHGKQYTYVLPDRYPRMAHAAAPLVGLPAGAVRRLRALNDHALVHALCDNRAELDSALLSADFTKGIRPLFTAFTTAVFRPDRARFGFFQKAAQLIIFLCVF